MELLAMVAPRDLPDDAARLDYVAAGDRLIAYVKALQIRAVQVMAGERASGSFLSETALEHEVAVARGTSTHAAGRVIENARALATVFGGFAQALRDGTVSEAHVNLLVERTRNVADPGLLAAIAERVLPKAKRMPPGMFGKEVAKAVADLDRDAEERHRRAKSGSRVWTSPMDDGMGFLGVVDDQATIAAMAATVDGDAAWLRTQRGGSRAVADGDDDARMDACRADALATRVLGTVVETSDGEAGGSCGEATVSFTRQTLPVVLNLVMDLDTEFPEGPSSAGNTGGMCGTDHQLKTAGLVDITDSSPDGSCTWTTALGQRIEIPPRPFLHDPHDDARDLPTAGSPRREPGPPDDSLPPDDHGPPDTPPFSWSGVTGTWVEGCRDGHGGGDRRVEGYRCGRLPLRRCGRLGRRALLPRAGRCRRAGRRRHRGEGRARARGTCRRGRGVRRRAALRHSGRLARPGDRLGQQRRHQRRLRPRRRGRCRRAARGARRQRGRAIPLRGRGGARDVDRARSCRRGDRQRVLAAAVLGSPGEWVHYAASKAALDTLTVGLAREVATEGVRVNAVAVGLVDTDFHAAAGEPDRPERIRPTVPMRRSGTPEEVAAAVCWLLSDDASYTTGTVLAVSGGR